jgi:SAM-dependent methyltransferase
MTIYGARYAELYDLFYADKPYAEEARFVHDCIQEFGPRPAHDVLELACGTGRHALELEKFGYNITATDRSADMIEIARRRAANNGSKVEFAVSDMRQLELPAKEYDAVVCLFDSIGYLKTDEALHDGFDVIWNRLRAGGVFIFEFWHAPTMLGQFSPTRVRKLKTAEGEIVRTSRTMLDRDNCLAIVDYTFDEQKNDGRSSTFRETHTNRFFFVDEMKKRLSAANLEPLKFFAGYEKAQPITDGTWHIVAVARKS